MKTWSLVLLSAALCGLFTAVNPARAQGTAFTYQGQLSDSGGPASGTYNFTFTLYTNSSGGTPVAGPAATNGVLVTNGLFTVQIDFGAEVWNGQTNWLELAVETNTANTFTTLAPRQQVTPTPYAIFATTASNLSGILPAAQLPPGVVTNNETGVSVSGTFTGNGGGLTNVPADWQTVSGTSQTAAANYAYLLTNNSLSTLTLPATPNVGDIVTVSGSGSNGWQVVPNGGQTIAGYVIPAGVVWTAQNGVPEEYWESVASSADGTKLVGVAYGIIPGGPIYTSVDSGVTWTLQGGAPATSWFSVASSADGTKLVAVASNGGQIYTSVDSGMTWTLQSSAPSANWSGVASSANGQNLVAVVSGGQIYTSPDSGVTWTPQSSAPSANWSSVASSANGQNLVAVASSGQIYTSINSGMTWTPQSSAPTAYWQSVTSSADGTKLAAVVYGGQIYTSGDSGMTWTPQNSTPTANWYSVASSADGTKLAAVVSGGQIYTSPDSGMTWTAQSGAPAELWSSVASSADGTKLVAGTFGNVIYTSDQTDYFSGNPGTKAQFQYVGNGVWQPLGQNAGQIAGTLPAAVLPSAVVTNGEGGVTFSNLNVNGATVSTLAASNVTASDLTVSGTNVIAPLTVPPSVPVSAIGTVGTGQSPYCVAVAGRYAYVANADSSTLQIIDVSTPSNPVTVGEVGTGESTLSVAVAGRYAYTVSGINLQVIDVGNPANPVVVGSLAAPGYQIAVSGHYAYVVTGGSGNLEIIDIGNPANPVIVGTANGGSGSQIYTVAVSGKYAYVIAQPNLEAGVLLQVFDVSNPANPVLASSVDVPGGSTPDENGIAVSGRYVYMASGNSLYVLDVSNPANPVLVGTGQNYSLYTADSVAVAGRYACVTSDGGVLFIFDVSDPTNPVTFGSTSIDSEASIAMSGRYAYVVSGAHSLFQVFDLGGAYIQPLEAGTIETGSLQTRDTATVGNDLNVRGGLTVGGSAHISGGLSVNDITGGLTTNIVVTVPTGTKTLYFTNGVLRAAQ